jgi:formylglycine-generating enzyme required for sulfatase activity
MVQLDIADRRQLPWKPLGVGVGILVLAIAGFLGWNMLPKSPLGDLPGWTLVANTVPSEFRAGSTEPELADALSLCRQSSLKDSCQASWFESETLRVVNIGRIRVDPTEVTNRDFAAFAETTKHRTTAEKLGKSANGMVVERNLSWRAPTRQRDSHLSRPDHPVVHVSREDAMAYCSEQGKRLPTEDEWEFAARGTARHVFPWGNRWDESKANWGQPKGGTRPVGSFPAGNTPTGHQDMAGNVWEWTASDEGEHAILKGGSWSDENPANLRGAARLIEDPSYTSSDIGFRCVEDV